MAGCREVTRDLTLAAEVPLSSYRRVQIAVHLLMCRHCRRHKAQLEQISSLLAQSAEDEGVDAELPADARERIGSVLQRR